MDVTTGHNNKVLEELNVTATSDGYILFLFWKNVTVHQTINILLLNSTKTFFKQRMHYFCYVSLFHTGVFQSIFPCITGLDAVKHLTTWKDHLRLLKASPNMYTNLRPMQFSKQSYITLDNAYLTVFQMRLSIHITFKFEWEFKT